MKYDTSDTPPSIVQENDGFNVIFIHSSLDDMGLTANEFRIYAHLARRANKKSKQAWPSIPSMAKVCRISEESVRYALKCLEGFGMIRRFPKRGKPDTIMLTSASSWVVLDRIKNVRTLRKKNKVVGISQPLPLGNSQPKGYPLKEIQLNSVSKEEGEVFNKTFREEVRKHLKQYPSSKLRHIPIDRITHKQYLDSVFEQTTMYDDNPWYADLIPPDNVPVTLGTSKKR